MLQVIAPAHREIGPKSLLVINPDGQSALLDNVLFYTDDADLVADLTRKQQQQQPSGAKQPLS